MHRALLIITLALTGCTVTYEQPIMAPVNPTYVKPLLQSLAQSQIQASQLNQLMQGVYGPNKASQMLLDYQYVNRQLQYFLNSPFEYVVVNRQWTTMQ